MSKHRRSEYRGNEIASYVSLVWNMVSRLTGGEHKLEALKNKMRERKYRELFALQTQKINNLGYQDICNMNFVVYIEKHGLILILYVNLERWINPLKPNDAYRRRTAPLTSKFAFLYSYSTNIGTEYFKHGIYSPFFPLQNAVCFIILTYLVPVLFTFCIQNVLKLKK